MLISHREPRVDVWRRQPDDTWVQVTAGAGDTVRLASLDDEVRVDEIYRGGLEDADARPAKT